MKEKTIYIEGLDKTGKDTLAEKLCAYFGPENVIVRKGFIAQCSPYIEQLNNKLKEEQRDEDDILKICSQAALFDYTDCFGVCNLKCFKGNTLIIVSQVAPRSYSYHSGFQTGKEELFRKTWNKFDPNKIDLPILLTVSPEIRSQRTNSETASRHDLDLVTHPEATIKADIALRKLLEEAFKSRLLLIDTSNKDQDQVFNLAIKQL